MQLIILPTLHQRSVIQNYSKRHGRERRLEADENDIWDLPVIAFNPFDILRSTEKFMLEVVLKF